MRVHRISAITLKVNEMESSCRFYSKIPGFRIVYGGASDNTFSIFEISEGERKAYLNLELIEVSKRESSLSKLSNKRHDRTIDLKSRDRGDDYENSKKVVQENTEQEKQESRWNFERIIFHTEDVDDLYWYMRKDKFLSKHAMFEMEPTDAPWGERSFTLENQMVTNCLLLSLSGISNNCAVEDFICRMFDSAPV